MLLVFVCERMYISVSLCVCACLCTRPTNKTQQRRKLENNNRNYTPEERKIARIVVVGTLAFDSYTYNMYCTYLSRSAACADGKTIHPQREKEIHNIHTNMRSVGIFQSAALRTVVISTKHIYVYMRCVRALILGQSRASPPCAHEKENAESNREREREHKSTQSRARRHTAQNDVCMCMRAPARLYRFLFHMHTRSAAARSTLAHYPEQIGNCKSSVSF